MTRQFAFGGALLLCLGLTGCAGESSPDGIEHGQSDQQSALPPPGQTGDGSFPFVIIEETEYYATSPQQGAPPDGQLPAGTKVTVRRRTGGYSLIESDGGVTGYVLSDKVSDGTSNALE